MDTRRDDSPDSMREWRWRAYCDHLKDLGYELDSGAGADDLGESIERLAVPVGAALTSAGGSTDAGPSR